MGIAIIAVFALLILLFISFLIITYNNLVKLRQRVQNAWAQVDVQLKRRYDLIPNLVATVKGYAGHEKETLESVIQARSMVASAGSLEEQIHGENMLTGALRSLFAVAEAYPDLKANTNYLQLQNELADTEGKIAFSRQFYNDTVQKMNTKVEVFPANLVASMLGFSKVAYFNLQGGPEVRQAVKVDF